MLKEKPDINPVSQKIMEVSTTKSAYAQLKVEDRLRMYGIKLNDSKDLKRLELNNQQEYQSQATTPGQTVPNTASNLNANSSSARGFVFEGQKDGQSINSRTSEIRAMQQEFEKRQHDYASKKQ